MRWASGWYWRQRTRDLGEAALRCEGVARGCCLCYQLLLRGNAAIVCAGAAVTGATRGCRPLVLLTLSLLPSMAPPPLMGGFFEGGKEVMSGGVAAHGGVEGGLRSEVKGGEHVNSVRRGNYVPKLPGIS